MLSRSCSPPFLVFVFCFFNIHDIQAHLSEKHGTHTKMPRLISWVYLLAFATSAVAIPMVKHARNVSSGFDSSKFSHYLEIVPHKEMDGKSYPERVQEGPILVPAIDVPGHGGRAPVRLGEVMKMFEPILHIDTGCAAEAAVTDIGQVNQGLKASGAKNGNCAPHKGHVGQTYVRGGHFTENIWALSYAWYMPKDQNKSGPVNGGHRHEWEHVVIFIDPRELYHTGVGPTVPRVLGVSASSHGGYKKKAIGNAERLAKYTYGGTHIGVHYYRSGGIMNHSLKIRYEDPNAHGFDTIDMPLIDWDAMSEVARQALNNHDWRSATFPMGDKWKSYLERAWDDKFNKG